MSNARPTLEQMRDSFAPPPGGLERLAARRRGRERNRRIAAGAVALLLFGGLVVAMYRALPHSDPPRPTTQQAPIPEGWTELPLPPEVRQGAALVWTGSEVLAWGGCTQADERGCTPTADGFSFDPANRTWNRMPEGPAAASEGHGVWTGREAIFLGLGDEDRLDGQAFDPRERTWREIPPAPIAPRYGAAYVWTGAELIVWGGGPRGSPTAHEGAAYDPAKNAWRRLTDAPLGLNLVSGMWTGEEVLVFGSLLGSGNRAATSTSVGVAYNPTTDRWRELPPSKLSPQATSAAWTGDRTVAWDYARFQEYDFGRDAWSPPQEMPFEPADEYPDSVPVDGHVFGFFGVWAALYDPATGAWEELQGGPLDEEIWSDAHGRSFKLWRLGRLLEADNVVFLALEGITVDEEGTVCQGCPGSPVSFWAYRPPF
jgi:hypothetical protein